VLVETRSIAEVSKLNCFINEAGASGDDFANADAGVGHECPWGLSKGVIDSARQLPEPSEFLITTSNLYVSMNGWLVSAFDRQIKRGFTVLLAQNPEQLDLLVTKEFPAK
jgi:hypothetical protein